MNFVFVQKKETEKKSFLAAKERNVILKLKALNSNEKPPQRAYNAIYLKTKTNLSPALYMYAIVRLRTNGTTLLQ